MESPSRRKHVFASLLSMALACGIHGQDDIPQTQMNYGARLSLPGGAGNAAGANDLLAKSNSGAMVNEFTGQAAFDVSLGGVSAQNGLGFSLNLSYFGGATDAMSKALPQYAPGSWVGSGFTLKAPHITVSGESVLFADQKYFLSLDGKSQQELIPQGTPNLFVLKNDPYIKIRRVDGTKNSILKDRCPGQLDQLTPYSTPNILYWSVDFPDGTNFVFGGEVGDCDESEYELCQPIVGHNYKYNPFYALELRGKSSVVFYLSRIKDRQSKSAIWFRYEKVTESVIGQCNSVNTTPFATELDRAIYLKEVYSTNGPNSGDFKTSRIVLNTAAKTEESVHIPTKPQPMAFYESKKLTDIQFYENGFLVHSLLFNYVTAASRMSLQSIRAQAPVFPDLKNILTLGYVPGTNRLSTLEDASGKIVEFAYGTVDADPVSGASSVYQNLDLAGTTFPYANTRIVYARQHGNKFYLQTENWSTGCLGSTADKFMEKLYEYENNGTYWVLKRTIVPPVYSCPTMLDFFMSPDGDYFVWTYNVSGGTSVNVYDLTTEDAVPPRQELINREATGNQQHVTVYAYSNWFALYNFDFKRNISFYSKTSSGHWTDVCPSGIAPSTYALPSPESPRRNNYSGENEDVAAGSCLTFGRQMWLTQGPNFLVANNRDLGILHVFGYDNGVKDHVRGLEVTTPALPNFLYPSEVQEANLAGVARPWIRTTSGNGVRYDNNWGLGNRISKVSVSENLIVVHSEATNLTKYIYVLGWDGKQLRYLYDQAVLANQNTGDGQDEIDFSVGSDYFILKNHYSGAGTDKGFWFYKVNLKTWSVVKTVLPVNPATNVDGEDWVIKTYPDYFFFEKMANLKGSESYTPALSADGVTSGGNYYPTLNDSRIFMLDIDRNPLEITSEFTRNPSGYPINTSNFSAQGDRILGVDTYKSGTDPILTSGYQTWRRNANAGTGAQFTRVPLPVSHPGTDQYYSARLVSGGTMVTTYTKNGAQESLLGLRFYPDAFDLVPSEANPANPVQGSTVVTRLKIKSDGAASVGNQIQEIQFAYPGTSPEGTTAKRLKNYQSHVPNFKYVRKELAEGAQTKAFVRDEWAQPVGVTDRSLIGTRTRSWTLPDKADFKKPGGAMDSTYLISVNEPASLSGSFAVRKVRDSSRTYFHSAHRGSAVYSTDYDPKNGKPKITVSKVRVSPTAEKYTVKLDRYHQDLVPTYSGPSFGMLRQTAVFQFPDDPCERDPGKKDPCSNLNPAWFTEARMRNVVSSTILTYDGADRVDAVYEWQPDFLGDGSYPLLDGNPVNPVPPFFGWIWKKVSSITQRQDQVPVARCRSDLPTESEQIGVFATRFYGGADCHSLGEVANSALFSTALLSGEEDIKTEHCPGGLPCLGAFGRWVASGSVLQNQIVHTGEKAISVTALYGPSINLKIREKAGFMDRQKGFLVSAWMLAKPNSDPAFRVEFRRNVSPPVPGTGADPIVYSIDLVEEHIHAKGPFPVNTWVKLERFIPYEELSTKGVFAAPISHDYLRIWIGKGAATTASPVYVDDIRLYPADAEVTTRNFDGTGLLRSTLDAQNEPVFFEYDIWRTLVGARKKDGLVHTSTAVKQIHE